MSLFDYVNADPRTVSIRVGVTPGYAAARWRPGIVLAGSYLQFCTARVQNTGTAEVVVKFDETDEVSGTPRTILGVAVVQPGGFEDVLFSPTKKLVELKGVAGNGPVTVDINTRVDWSNEGFSQDYDANYSQKEWAAEPVVAASASQTFTSSDPWVIVHNLGFMADVTLVDADGDDITSLATFSASDVNGTTATFGTNKAGRAFSTK